MTNSVLSNPSAERTPDLEDEAEYLIVETATGREIPLTQEMVEAGVAEMSEHIPCEDSMVVTVRMIFRAMIRLADI
jgi:hypothetical protein